MGYELDGCGSIFDKGKKFFSALQYLDRLWDPHSLLSSGYIGGKAAVT
jgi:hypothetical protein